MKIIQSIKKSYEYINPVSRFIIKAAAVFVLSAYTLAICAFICAGRGFDFYEATALGASLLGCIKPSLGVMLLGALLFEAVWTPKSENSEE